MARNAQSFVITERPLDPAPAGAIRFLRTEKGICGFEHSCPCGCGGWSFVRLNPENWAPEGRTPMWSRTGDDLHMTLTPSIGVHPKDERGGYHWHGYLRNGVFEEC